MKTDKKKFTCDIFNQIAHGWFIDWFGVFFLIDVK